MEIRSYEDLEVWQISMDFVEAIYNETESFPDREKYGLTAQVRRAGLSIPSNIAEGKGRRTVGEYLQHLGIARSSLMEVRTQLELSRRLKMMNDEACEQLMQMANKTGRLLNGLINALEKIY